MQKLTEKIRSVVRFCTDRRSPNKRFREGEADEAESLPRGKRPAMHAGGDASGDIHGMTPQHVHGQAKQHIHGQALPAGGQPGEAMNGMLVASRREGDGYVLRTRHNFTWVEFPPPSTGKRNIKRPAKSGRATELVRISTATLTPKGDTMYFGNLDGETSQQLPRSTVEVPVADIQGRNILAKAVQLQQEQQHHRQQQIATQKLNAHDPSSEFLQNAPSFSIARQAREQVVAEEDAWTANTLYYSKLITLLRKAAEAPRRGMYEDDEMQRTNEMYFEARKRAKQQLALMSSTANRHQLSTSVYDTAAAQAKEQEAKELEVELDALRLQRERKVVPLSLGLAKEDYAAYNEATHQSDPAVLASHKQTGIDVKGRDMAKLAPGCWLNDEIVNVYIGMLQERDTRRRDGGAHAPKCHFFNSFFTSKLYLESGKYDYSAVRRWTMPKRLKTTGQRSDSILDCDRIIIPVNKGGMHWVCAVIDLKGSKFVLYDSLGGTDHVLLANLAKYVCDEYKNKRDAERTDVLKWPREFPTDVPQQQNGYDCGVFTLLFANYAGIDAAFNFSQSHMADMRVKLVKDILRLRVD